MILICYYGRLSLAKLQPQLLAVANIAFTVRCTAVVPSALQLPLAIFCHHFIAAR